MSYTIRAVSKEGVSADFLTTIREQLVGTPVQGGGVVSAIHEDDEAIYATVEGDIPE
jgi:hypothetical protein